MPHTLTEAQTAMPPTQYIAVLLFAKCFQNETAAKTSTQLSLSLCNIEFRGKSDPALLACFARASHWHSPPRVAEQFPDAG